MLYTENVLNISRKLIKSGILELNYNNKVFLKKYELGYWDTVQDIYNDTKQPASGFYLIFRPIYKTSSYKKAIKQYEKNI